MNLVLLETSGNQRYIFATNKLRENVGASELTYRVGTKTVLEAVEEVTKEQKKNDPTKQSVELWDDDPTGEQVRANLLNQTLNPNLEDNKCDIEVIVATSGKAILLVRTKQIGKDLIKRVTQTALRDMPGLTVHGAISGEVESNLSNIHEAIVEVHHKLDDIRYQMPSNEQRFSRLPFFAPCATSGLPAQKYAPDEKESVPRFSGVALKKREKSEEGRRRLESVIRSVSSNLYLADNINELEKKFEDTSWLAVIHADGNGLGEIFRRFDKHTGFRDGKCSAREYLDKYREFSLELDRCTIQAVGKATITFQDSFRKHLQEQGRDSLELPIIPLILGGDDLTVLCDGEYALKFTHDFLKQFEEETRQNKVIWRIANNAFGNKDENKPSVIQLGICAGVAIIKPHFPFHQAYELAESLLKSAKQVKEKFKHLRTGKDGKDEEVQLPASAMDFHILYDSTYSELELIREKLRVDNERTYLYAKPYVVSVIDENEIKFINDADEKKAKASKSWLKYRKFNELENRVEAMNERDDDNKRKLPNSQLHGLREALFLGKDETTARVNLIAHRYESESQEKEKSFGRLLVEETKTLFFDETRKTDENEVTGHATHFLDALDVIEFWKGFPEPKSKSDSVEQTDNGGKENE